MKASTDILLATYNNESFILSQLESLRTQTCTDFHLWIRDDASQDETPQIVKNFAKHHPELISFIPGQENLGCKDNFAFLANQSRADYIFFSDADDVWLPTKVEKSLASMSSAEKEFGKDTPILVHTDLQVVDRNLKTIHPSFWRYSCLSPHKASHLNRTLIQNSVTGCTMLINRALLQLALPIPTSAIMHDWWIALVAAALGKIITIDEPTLLYRQHGKNTIGAQKSAHFKNPLGLFRELKKICLQKERQKIYDSLLRTFNQAETLYERYHSRMSMADRNLLHDYLTLSKKGFIEKRTLLIRNNFFKSTVLKNLGTFLFI